MRKMFMLYKSHILSSLNTSAKAIRKSHYVPNYWWWSWHTFCSGQKFKGMLIYFTIIFVFYDASWCFTISQIWLFHFSCSVMLDSSMMNLVRSQKSTFLWKFFLSLSCLTFFKFEVHVTLVERFCTIFLCWCYIPQIG